MKNRVLIDSCVLISASVNVSSNELGLGIRHEFYYECNELIEYLEKNIARRIGIVTSTIENEATGVLDRVVEGELESKKVRREEDFELFSRILNICDGRLRKILSFLQREPVDAIDVSMKLPLIQRMYKELKEKAKTLPQVISERKRLVPKRFKRALDWYKIFKRQEEMENSQSLNLLRKDVEYEDMLILAEAFHLCNLYLQTEVEKGDLYIASKDHHFVPIRRRGWTYEGRGVTDEIKRRFGVICEHPRRVKEQLLKG